MAKGLVLIILCLLGIILCLVGLGFSIYFYLSKQDIKDYAVIFDAGSSGSRMYVYEWSAKAMQQKRKNLGIKQITTCNAEDKGINKITSLQEVVHMFSNCIAKAHDVIPDDRQNRTKISLVATGGMRLLEISSKDTMHTIFDYFRNYFRSTGFLINNSSQVKIISGQDEALNAWISANFFDYNFDRIGLDETKGILDLGGASTQIVFLPKNPDETNSKDINLFGMGYKANYQSTLCYGMNEANLMYRVKLMKHNNFRHDTPASCYPKESDIHFNKLEFNKSPCANGFIHKDKDIPDGAFQRNYTFKGQSNYENCIVEIKELFKRPTCTIGSDQCSFANTIPANDTKNSRFLAISAFWFTMDQTNRILNKTHDGDMDSFKHSTSYICRLSSQDLKTLNEQSNANIDEFRLNEMCFWNVYSIELLAKYGFDSLEKIQFVDKLNGYSIGWTLGYLINELSGSEYLPREELPRKLPLLYFILTVVGISILILVLLAILIAYLVKKRDSFSLQPTA